MTAPTPLTPATAPEGLPELIVVQCDACSGSRYAETFAGELVECPMCDNGTQAVCSGCGQEPTVTAGLEQCGCIRTEPCELCGTPAPLNAAAICATCHAEGMADWQREEDERAVWVAEQLALGVSYGWLE